MNKQIPATFATLLLALTIIGYAHTLESNTSET
jgi:hypothetical protein